MKNIDLIGTLTTLILEKKESKKTIALIDKYTKPVGKNPALMGIDKLGQIIFADPTTKKPQGDFDITNYSEENLKNVQPGDYVNWLLKNFEKPQLDDTGDLSRARSLFMEDLFKVTEDLVKFTKYKQYLPVEKRNINNYNSPDTLFTFLNNFELPERIKDKLKKTEFKKEIRKERKGFEHPGGKIEVKGKNYTVIKIEGNDAKSRDAACWYGGYYHHEKGESRWCTSPENSAHFEGYIKRGPLYVILANDDDIPLIRDSESLANELGAEFEQLSEKERTSLRLENGVKVTKIKDGKLRSSGVLEGFIITHIGDKPVDNLEDITNALKSERSGMLIEGIYPDGSRAYYGLGIKVGQSTGLPQERYQFHFESDMFMDRLDKSINVVDFLNKKAPDLKEYFKSKFAKGLVEKGDKVDINYPNSAAGKYIALYGFEELIENLPDNITEFGFVNKSSDKLAFDIPASIGKFKQLYMLQLDGIVKSLPDEIGGLSNLYMLVLANNKDLKSLPASIGKLNSLVVLNLMGCNPKVFSSLPQEVQQQFDAEGHAEQFYVHKTNL